MVFHTRLQIFLNNKFSIFNENFQELENLFKDSWAKNRYSVIVHKSCKKDLLVDLFSIHCKLDFVLMASD